jgi:hypothetical protein
MFSVAKTSLAYMQMPILVWGNDWALFLMPFERNILYNSIEEAISSHFTEYMKQIVSQPSMQFALDVGFGTTITVRNAIHRIEHFQLMIVKNTCDWWYEIS